MSGFEDYDVDGTMTIAGFAMCRPAWMIAADDQGEGGLLDLITGGELRGEDRIVPHTPGRKSYKRILDASRWDFNLWVNGDVNYLGVDTSNSEEGLAANLALIRSTLFEGATTAADGTLAASVTIPGWGTKTANITMVGLERQRYNKAEDQAIWLGTLQISVPAGRFA